MMSTRQVAAALVDATCTLTSEDLALADANLSWVPVRDGKDIVGGDVWSTTVVATSLDRCQCRTAWYDLAALSTGQAIYRVVGGLGNLIAYSVVSEGVWKSAWHRQVGSPLALAKGALEAAGRSVDDEGEALDLACAITQALGAAKPFSSSTMAVVGAVTRWLAG